MKTKELIRLLQEEDPTGEIECCIDNKDIHFLETKPAYWDGRLQVFIRDPSKRPYYDIVGAKYTSVGSKIQIHSMDTEDLIWNDVNIPIDYSEIGSEQRISEQRIVDDRVREEARKAYGIVSQ